MENRKRTRDYKNDLIDRLKDFQYAWCYLKACFEDAIDHNDFSILQVGMNDISEALGDSISFQIFLIPDKVLTEMYKDIQQGIKDE
jgi:hypothetical protein